ncbi:MAG: DUF2110 family protein [Candidatus Bathyarchaeia archaeon]
MREVVLLQKIYNDVSLREFEEFLKKLCEGLRVQLMGLNMVANRWVKIRVSGDDEKVAVLFLGKELGLAPISIGNVKQFSILRGRVMFSQRSPSKVFVDVGVFSPKPVYAVVSLQRLQGQLVDGKKFALKRIVELFGLVDGFPLEVQVVRDGINEFEAKLTEKQIKLYSNWIGSRVDRLIVLGALGEKIEKAVRKAGLKRYVIGIESLSILDHVVVCKLGTDAIGLIPKLRRQLFRVSLVRFSPRRVLELVGGL